MPRYFFDFRQGTDRCADAEGSDFANVEQAYLEAFKGAQDMWSELLRRRQDPRQCVFEVRNDRRQLLFTLPFQEVMESCIDRKGPAAHITFDTILETAHQTKKLTGEFQEALHSVRRTLDQSRELMKLKVEA